MADWAEHKANGYRVLSWDWREQPDFTELSRIVAELSGGRVHVAEPDTQSDQYALVFEDAYAGPSGKGELDEARATEVYKAWWKAEEGHG